MSGIVFATGLDESTTLTHIFNSAGFGGLGGSGSITSVGRNGTNGFRSTYNAGGQNSQFVANKTLPATLATLYFAFAFRFSALPEAGQYAVAQLLDLGVPQLTIALTVDGTLRVLRGDHNGTLLGTSSISLLPNVYYHIEQKATIDPSAGVIDLRVNETSVLSLTGQNTRATANSYATAVSVGHRRLGLANSTSFNYDYDDIIVRDDQFVGDRQVLTLFPNGTGAIDDWSKSGAATSHEATDEMPPNDNTDYIYSSTPGDKTVLTYPNIPATSSIDAIIPKPRLEKTDAGTATARSFWYNGSTDFPGATKSPSNGAYEYHPDIWMINPDTGVAFTPTDWNTSGNGVGIERVS